MGVQPRDQDGTLDPMKFHAPVSTVAVLLVSPLVALGKEDAGTVIALRNRAEACAPATNCRELDFGSKVVNGDSLKTYADSRLTVRFPTGSRLDMGPNSVLVMASLQSDGKKTFAKWGEFDFEVKKPDSKGRFQVRTPVAVAGAEGTKFHVEVDTGTGESRLRLDNGLLSIVPEDPRIPSFVMRAGDALEIKTGAPPILRNLDGTLSTPSSIATSTETKTSLPPAALIPKEAVSIKTNSGKLRIEVVP